MIFTSTDVTGVMLITPDQFDDERGFFARTWAADEFEAHGLLSNVVQRNLSYNRTAGTLRGMHYQNAPHAEVKIVSCLVGAISRRDAGRRSMNGGLPGSAGPIRLPSGCAASVPAGP
jgi:dTDP-4-dehydrorhamnose 3,5-epimerase-like enzyme